MTDDVARKAPEILARWRSRRKVAVELGIKFDMLRQESCFRHMNASCAVTTMVEILRKKLAREDDSGALVRNLFRTSREPHRASVHGGETANGA